VTRPALYRAVPLSGWRYRPQAMRNRPALSSSRPASGGSSNSFRIAAARPNWPTNLTAARPSNGRGSAISCCFSIGRTGGVGEPLWDAARTLALPDPLARKIALFRARGNFIRYETGAVPGSELAFHVCRSRAAPARPRSARGSFHPERAWRSDGSDARRDRARCRRRAFPCRLDRCALRHAAQGRLAPSGLGAGGELATDRVAAFDQGGAKRPRIPGGR
jgi:hypothetical protein